MEFLVFWLRSVVEGARDKASPLQGLSQDMSDWEGEPQYLKTEALTSLGELF